MATRLKDTDVVVIGLGAAGGVAGAVGLLLQPAAASTQPRERTTLQARIRICINAIGDISQEARATSMVSRCVVISLRLFRLS